MIKIPELQVLVQPLYAVFTKPSRVLLENIIEGWILCPCRRFVTAIFQFGDPEQVHSHDAYHRWFRVGAWTVAALFQALARTIVALFGYFHVLRLVGDDTVHKKTGRRVNGAKTCRDAVRSTKKKVVYVWGLQIVLLCLEVIPPWGGEPLALPINMRLYRKRPNKDVGKTVLDLMRDMLLDIRDWFPGRIIYLTVDGFYASLAGRLPPGIHLISRIRSDAAIYRKAARKAAGQRGRPRSRGERLPTPEEIAAKATDWRLITTSARGKEHSRLVIIRHVVWHKVLPGKYIRLIISRDPKGIEKDDYFFTTDIKMDAEFLISSYFDRWCVEDTFRNGKQFLGIEQPQSWVGAGPEKVAAIGYAIYSLVWAWFIQNGDFKAFPDRPWYGTKTTPSFQDAMAGIRHQIWASRISETVPDNPEFHKFSEIMIDALSRAA